jgi:hypothetical protein
MQKAMNKYKLVKVNWVDSSTPRMGWTFLSDWKGVGSLDCVSIGYLIDENENTITIAPHLAYPDDEVNCQINGVMTIPSGCVTRLEELISSSPVLQLSQAS